MVALSNMRMRVLAMTCIVAATLACMLTAGAAFAQETTELYEGGSEGMLQAQNFVGALNPRVQTQSKAKTYAVVFKANKGKGSMARQTLKYGKSAKLRVNRFKRPGYMFTGWNTRSDGSGVAYKDEQAVRRLAKPGQTEVLYAQWSKKPTAAGFRPSVWRAGDTYKTATSQYGKNEERRDDGTAINTVSFSCNGDANTALHLSYKVTDVTPTPYRKMFTAMGVKRSKPKITMIELDRYSLHYFPTVSLPFPEGSKSNARQVKATSQVEIAIEYGQATRIVRLDAYCGTKKLDSIYVAATTTADGNPSKADIALAKKVRKRVEAKLWKPGMSKLEKLEAVAGYINKTTHYPNTNAATKEGNPAWWKRWSVEGVDLFYNMVNDPTLNGIMKFQGGITTCVAAGQLNLVATEDLGLRYLYDSEKDKVAKGEGVWIGMGEFSSNPSNPYHESLIYKDKSEKKHYIDVQGIGYESDGQNTCAMHGCEQYLISLS